MKNINTDKNKLARLYGATAIESVITVILAVYSVLNITKAYDTTPVNTDNFGLGIFLGIIAGGIVVTESITISNIIKYYKQQHSNEK